MGTQVNSDGLVIRFGRDQGLRGASAGVTRTAGKGNELVLEVNLAGAARTIFTMDRNNDGTLDGFSGLDAYIPAGAKIISFDTIETEALAGGTSYSIGTFALDGTAIDADGIRADAGTAGAQIGTVLTAKSFVSVKTIGTYTTGKLKIIVRFITV